MSRLKTLFKYVVWLVVFFIFSEVIINMGLNASYKPMEAMDSDISEVEITEAESTRINGRVKGRIKDTSELEGKYVKFDLYNERDNIVGTKYIEIGKEGNVENNSNIENNKKSQDFSFFFEAEGVKYFKTSIVDKIEGTLTGALGKIKLLDHDWNKAEILTALIFTYGIFF